MICTQSEGVLTDCPQRPALSLFVAPTKSRETARRERAERCLCRVTAARDKAINPTQHLTEVRNYLFPNVHEPFIRQITTALSKGLIPVCQTVSLILYALEEVPTFQFCAGANWKPYLSARIRI